jgi:succinoglycan biosynthesis protein ExoU
MSKPLSISVIIAAWNAEATIARAIQSALQQQHVSEVIVVDDASTDSTVAVACSAGQGSSLLKIIQSDRNRGPSAARNLALEQTNADAVCVLDADDYMLPGRLERMAKAFDHCDFLADDLLYAAPPDFKVQRRNLLGLTEDERRDLSLTEFLAGSICDPKRPRGELGFLKPLISKRFLDAHGLRYRVNIRLGEDYALYVESLRQGARFRLIDACGYVCVERANSLSSRHRTADLANFLSFDDEMLLEDLTPEVRSVLERHRFNTACRLAHRELLDAKRSRRYVDALRTLFTSPQIAAYVTRAIIRDKFGT